VLNLTDLVLPEAIHILIFDFAFFQHLSFPIVLIQPPRTRRVVVSATGEGATLK
jgi:hypothetical protein